MEKVCKEHLDGYKVFNRKILLLISFGMIACGLLLLFLYNNIYLRYTVIAISLIICFIKRKQIKNIVQKVRDLKKA